jgi:hypothetical protein
MPMTDLRARFQTLDALDVPDVMGRAELIGAKPPSPDLEPPRRGRVGAGVVGLIVGSAAIVFVAWAFRPGAPAPSAPSSSPGPRLVMPVPAGAEPSMPLTGNVLLQVQAYTGKGTNMWLVLLEDGRLITNRSSLNEWHDMNWTERRLTPTGVDLVRSKIERLGTEQVGTGGLPHFFRVRGKLADPATWLPSSAWEQAEARPFVPRGYLMIVRDLDPKSAGWVKQRPKPNIDGLVLPPGIDLASAPTCSLLTLAQTQELVAALDAVDTRFAGDQSVGPDGSSPGVGMTWALRRTHGDPLIVQLDMPLPDESCGHLDGR